mgnify:CR=1 FL=1
MLNLEAGERLVRAGDMGSEMFVIGDASRFHEFDEVEEWGVTAPGAVDPADRLVVYNGNPTNAFVFPDFTVVEGAERLIRTQCQPPSSRRASISLSAIDETSTPK